MISSVDHLIIAVNDLDQATENYKKIFGISPCWKGKRNELGTKNVLDNAIKYHVTNFVLVSTDKAVNPSNVMGASKRIAEIYASILSDKSETRIIITRFGNVLGSSGSVVPIFKKQILNGGPVTITDPDITRYFMLVSEASNLVLQAASIGKNNEILILDMGDPIKISDAREIISPKFEDFWTNSINIPQLKLSLIHI